MEERFIKAADGHRLFLRVWPCNDPIGVVHINHGMAEHSLRYDDFARELNRYGFSVYAQDHRGHGKTIENDEKGWFAEKGGWSLVADDAAVVDRLAMSENPGLPLILFGHSMGSFVARTCLNRHSEYYAAAVICGTGASQGIVGAFGRKLASLRARIRGSRTKDRFMQTLAFGSYLSHFPGEGKTAWLSKDKDMVSRYDGDPLCGFVCSSQFYADLIEGSFTANDRKAAQRIRKDLPMLIISGKDDPVGGYGKGVEKVYRMYKDAGLENVTLRLLENDRHEILNETDRDEVMKTMIEFMIKAVKSDDR